MEFMQTWNLELMNWIRTWEFWYFLDGILATFETLKRRWSNWKKHWRQEGWKRAVSTIKSRKTLRLPFGKLTWQWKMDLLKMYSLLNLGIFQCHVSFLEGMYQWRWPLDFVEKGLWKRICFLGLDSSWRRGCRCFQSTPIKSAEDDAH